MASHRRSSAEHQAPPTSKEREIFKKYDRNKTGAIEIDELRELMADLGLLGGRLPAEASSYVVAAFTAADADKDMALNLPEFASYYRRATAPRLSDLLAAQHPEQLSALRRCFAQWASFGVRSAQAAAELGTAHWAKLCKDTGLVGPRALSSTDADIIFMKVKSKGAQRLTFHQFVDALGMVAARQGVDVIQVVRQVNASAGPLLNGTQVEAVRFFDSAAPRGGAAQLRQKSAGGGGGAPRPAATLSPTAAAAPSEHPLGANNGSDSNTTPGGGFTIPAYIPAARCATPPTPVEEVPSPLDGAKGLRAAANVEDLLRVYASFAGFGAGSASPATSPLKMDLDSKQFMKLCKDSGLVGGRVTSVAVDLCFMKARGRGARRLAFSECLVALALLAQEKGVSEAEVLAAVAACPGPRRSSTTTPEYVRLAERASFTGVYARGGPQTVDKSAPDLAKLLSREPARG